MTNSTCKGCPERSPGCHDRCERFQEWRKTHAAELRYTNANHAAERIGRNDFNKEGWMREKRR